MIKTEITEATTSMTSVPKPLKYLRPHYETLKHCHRMARELNPSKKLMADLLAVLAMTMSEPGSHEILHFKKQGTINDLASWGHEFVRALAGSNLRVKAAGGSRNLIAFKSTPLAEALNLSGPRD